MAEEEIDWRALAARILRPRRAHINACETRIAREKVDAAARAQRYAAAIERVEFHLNHLRAAVRASTGDAIGRIPYEMTEIEREALRLMRERETTARAAFDALWRDLAPESWRSETDVPAASDVWARGSTPRDLETLFALAADPEGVRQIETEAAKLRSAMAPWGVAIAERASFRVTRRVSPSPRVSLAAPIAAALAALANAGAAHEIAQHAHRTERAVRRELGPRVARQGRSIARRFGEDLFSAIVWRAAWTRDLRVPDAHAAAGRLFRELADPFAPLLAMWDAGYVPGEIAETALVECTPIDPS